MLYREKRLTGGVTYRKQFFIKASKGFIERFFFCSCGEVVSLAVMIYEARNLLISKQ